MAKTSWKKAVIKVLIQADEAMDYKDIAEKIVSNKIKKKVGATPSISVNTAIRNSIKKEGVKSPFEWVAKGLYRLQPNYLDYLAKSSDVEVTHPFKDQDENGTKTSIIHAFGMYWQREKVKWATMPKLYGIQQAGTKKVDFSQQKGIYLLHDNIEVIYVGRSTDRPLGVRLFEHTKNRLNGRWNRFSWFGLLNVTEDGKLEEIQITCPMNTIINTFEALLIEGLEPRQNRRRGDALKDFEYLQVDDPSIKRQQKAEIMKEMIKSLNLDGFVKNP